MSVSNRGRVLDAALTAFVATIGVLWMFVCILVVASPFVLLLALSYWIVKQA